PLSKGLWKGEPEDSIWRKAAPAVGELHLGGRVVGIDLRTRTVTDDRGAAYGFKKLLLATGGAPRRLPLQSDQVIYFRTLDDYRRLRGLAEQQLRFAVVGGGFIGSEVAAALRLQGRDVVMLVPEAGLGARVFPADLSRLRVEHEDNANTMGKIAGQNMAGRATPYTHLPFFYSDLFELGYEAVGELDSRLEAVADWKTPFREGVVYYLQAGRVRGVLLWNTWGQVDHARALIAQPGPFRPADLKGRLPA